MGSNRRRTVTAVVGGVPVGQCAPDRRAVDDEHGHGRRGGDGGAGRGAGARRERAGPGHGQQRRRRRRRSPRSWRGCATAGVDVPIVGDFHYNGHLLLTRYPGVRARRWPSTGSTRATSAAKRRDDNFRTIVELRDRARQAGPHRRELGLARPAAPDGDDGRERAPPRAARREVGHDRGDARERAALGRARRGGRAAARPDRPLGEGLRRSGPRRPSTASSPRGATTRCTSG